MQPEIEHPTNWLRTGLEVHKTHYDCQDTLIYF